MDYDVILAALSPNQEQQIRNLFRVKKRKASEAEALITDWFRLAEVAHHYALQQREPRRYQALLSSSSVRKRRDRQLRQGTRIANATAQGLNKLVTIVGKHERDMNRYAHFEEWANAVAAHLRMTGQALEQKRRDWKTVPVVRPKRGTPRWFCQSCLLEVLVAYFRKQKWTTSATQTGLLGEVALVVCHGYSMNHKRLTGLAKSQLDYDLLEALAPKDVQFAKPPTLRRPRVPLRKSIIPVR